MFARPSALSAFHFLRSSDGGALVELALEVGELGLELEVAVPAVGLERAVGERGPDGAAGLGVVGAVGEPALVEEAP